MRTEIIKKAIEGPFSGTKNLACRKLNIPVKPRYVVYEITTMCNSRCHHCSIWKMPKNESELTKDEIIGTFSDKLFSDVEFVIITGGEPVLRKDLIEIMTGIHEKIPKARFSLSTNGLLPERVITTVKGCLDRGMDLDVGISLDGIGKHHDEIRGVPGNFEKVDMLIKSLMELKKEYGKRLLVTAGTTISNLTIDYVDEYLEYCKKMGLEQTIAWYQEASYYGNIGDNIQHDKTMKAVEKIEDSPRKRKWLEYLKTGKIKYPCFAMQTFFLLRSDGRVAPCLFYSEKIAGNVKEKTPTEIWNSKEALDLRNLVKSCKGCLNTWAYNWSIESCFYPMFIHYSKRPIFTIKKIVG